MFATISLIVVALILATAALFLPTPQTEEGAEEIAAGGQGIALEAAPQTGATVTSAEPVENGQEADTNAAPAEGGEGDPPALASTPSSTPTTAPTPTVTPSPTPWIVFVNSPVVGLYLRNGPGGEIILLLDDQTPLTVIGEIEILDEIEWMNVSGGEGEIGWVAADYVTDTPPPTETPSLDPELESESTPTETSP